MNRFNLSKESRQLRYVSVYDTLFKMINEGTFPEGSRLPSEPDLAKLIGVSRTTLRQSLALLQDDGIVKNIQGKGNFIIKTTPTRSNGLESLSHPIPICRYIDVIHPAALCAVNIYGESNPIHE